MRFLREDAGMGGLVIADALVAKNESLARVVELFIQIKPWKESLWSMIVSQCPILVSGVLLVVVEYSN